MPGPGSAIWASLLVTLYPEALPGPARMGGPSSWTCPLWP